MLKVKEELENINKKIKDLQETKINLFNLEDKLNDRKSEIKTQIVKENNILNETEWEVSQTHTDKVYLSAKKTAHDMPKLYELWKDEWEHWRLNLTKDILLMIDDGDVSICFKDNCTNEDIKKFIKDYKLKIYTDRVNNLIKEYKKSIDQLKQFKKDYVEG